MKRFTLAASFRFTVTLLFLIFSLAAFSGCGGGVSGSINPVGTGSVTLSWQAPTTNEDGTPLTDLAGYRVYYGETSGVYTHSITVGNYTSVSIGNLEAKDWYFVATAFSVYGSESEYSNEVIKTVTTAAENPEE